MVSCIKTKPNETATMKLENISKLGKLLKFIRCRSDYDHAEVNRGWLIMAISDYRSKASVINHIGRLSSELSQELALISFPVRWVEGHISHSSRDLQRCHPSNRLAPVIKLSFIHKHPLSSLFSNCHVKKLARFMRAQFARISRNISRSDSVSWKT